MRHSEINTNIVAWSRLLNKGGAAITAGTDIASPMGASGAKSTGGAKSNLKPIALNFDSDSSPPHSDKSGENSPKTPDSRRESQSSVFDKSDEEEINSSVPPETLPPPEPVTDADLMHVPDQIILEPPPEFIEEGEEPRNHLPGQPGKSSKAQQHVNNTTTSYYNGMDYNKNSEGTNGRPSSPPSNMVSLWAWSARLVGVVWVK